MIRFGLKLREVRKRFGYTLQELSSKTNLSVGYLSNIERDATSPTIEALEIICNALRVDITEILKSGDRSLCLMKKENRPILYSDKDGVLETVVVPNETFRCTSYTMADENDKYVIVREGDPSLIICYQLEGSCELQMKNETYRLEPGDTVVIPEKMPNRFRRLSDARNVTLWIYREGNRV